EAWPRVPKGSNKVVFPLPLTRGDALGAYAEILDQWPEREVHGVTQKQSWTCRFRPAGTRARNARHPLGVPGLPNGVGRGERIRASDLLVQNSPEGESTGAPDGQTQPQTKKPETTELDETGPRGPRW